MRNGARRIDIWLCDGSQPVAPLSNDQRMGRWRAWRDFCTRAPSCNASSVAKRERGAHDEVEERAFG
jgi:hypothetical protein